MSGFQTKLERYESLAAECQRNAKTANESNRGFYLRASEHYRQLADEVRALIATFDLAA